MIVDVDETDIIEIKRVKRLILKCEYLNRHEWNDRGSSNVVEYLWEYFNVGVVLEEREIYYKASFEKIYIWIRNYLQFIISSIGNTFVERRKS
jgi:hypothetical protein